MNKRRKNGFTLIEMMIALAIVGIVSSMAVGSYLTHTIRSQVSEGFKLAGGIETAISQYYVRGWSMPPDMEALMLPPANGEYVSSISQEYGVVTITYGNNAMGSIANGKVTLKASDNGDGNVIWSCSPDGVIIVKEYLPSSCS
ncbi:pilin [Burkholderia contaminans]|uniref:pilin n=1 Tax=Burkholderia contaminans TaxID=488447 RepID=UPI00158E2C58|nr:pilin [Burkholderia contaminans]